MSEKARRSVEPLDADGIYRQLGIYVVVFQALQNQLMQICWLLADPPFSDRARQSMVNKSFYWFVSETGRRVYDTLSEQGREESDFAVRFHASLRRCRELGAKRNRVVHSTYVHLEAGDELYGIVRSDMTKGQGDEAVDFDQECLTEQSFDSGLREIAETAFGLSLARVQLIHWQPQGGQAEPPASA